MPCITDSRDDQMNIPHSTGLMNLRSACILNVIFPKIVLDLEKVISIGVESVATVILTATAAIVIKPAFVIMTFLSVGKFHVV